MQEQCPAPTEPLRGPTVCLRPWRAEDAAWYVGARDEVIFRWTTEPRDLSAEALREVILRNNEQPRWAALAITDAASGALLGNIALAPRGDEPGRGVVSYCLAPEGRGRGSATEAVRLLVQWACTSGAVQRVALFTLPGNTASQGVALRAGFTRASEDEARVWFTLTCPQNR